MKYRLKKFLWVVGIAGLLVGTLGCRSARRGEPVVGPMTQLNEKAERGRLVFYEHCHTCHPGGEGGLAPALNDKPAPRFLMKTQVRLGLGAMPGFDRHHIPPEELDDLMEYLLALRRHGRGTARE
ncbi:MAG: cytochrome c [Verrucomicrobiota bacterium]